jgi:serine/threonine protein kinase
LDEIRHPNIVSLISTYQIVISNYCKKFCIVTEYCESNLNKLKVIKNLSDIAKLRICSEMMSGINAAHTKKIIHRDIKPENILIKDLNSFEIKIADFGCSKMKDEE